jgi:hypothetical protein
MVFPAKHNKISPLVSVLHKVNSGWAARPDHILLESFCRDSVQNGTDVTLGFPNGDGKTPHYY